MEDYRRGLDSAWREMESLYTSGTTLPEQDCEVRAILYHCLIGRLREDGVRQADIRPEETLEGFGRVDLIVKDRLFIVIRILRRRGDYSAQGWRRKVRTLERDVWRLKQCLESGPDPPRARAGVPVLALWDWKAGTKGLQKDLQTTLEGFRQRMEEQGVVVTYGPRGPISN